jgi:phage tail sheath gpL-like
MSGPFDTGVSASYKVPGFFGKIIFGAGTVSAGAVRLVCLLVGMKTSAGSLTVDSQIADGTSQEEADSYAGAGSQLARMAYSALQVPTVKLKMAAVTEPGGGTAATVTIVLTGTITAAGETHIRIAGKSYKTAFLATDTLDTIGAAVVAKISSDTRCPFSAAYNSSTDTITLTCRNKGTQGRDWIVYWVTDDIAASGLIGTIAGSSTVNTGGVRAGAASSGTGSEDVTSLLTKLLTNRYARVAVGHNDTTNAALWEAHVNAKALATTMLYDQLVFGFNGTYANAISLAATTLNAHRAQVVWHRNSESHPCEIAAYVAAKRSVVEQATWVPDYDGLELTPIAPQAFDADKPTPPEQDAALNNGVTPCTTVNGVAVCVRAITTYCRNGTAQDERCLDIGDAVCPDQAMIDLQLFWSTEFRPANPYVGPDPAEGDPEPPSGVAFPKLWNGKVVQKLEEWGRAGWMKFPPTGIWAPTSTFVEASEAIATVIPLPVRRLQHRTDQVMRQTAS